VRVLLVTSGQAWFGGIATHATLVSRELHRRGHDLRVISVGAPSPTDAMPWQVVQDVMHVPAKAPDAEFTFRHQVVAPAAGYVVALPEWSARLLSRVARRVSGPSARRSVRLQALLGLLHATIGVDAWDSAQRSFLERLLLKTHDHDLGELDRVRSRFDPDVEYLTDLALVPMVSRLPRRRATMFAASQGSELVVRRGGAAACVASGPQPVRCNRLGIPCERRGEHRAVVGRTRRTNSG
jgi:hypothetical protein